MMTLTNETKRHIADGLGEHITEGLASFLMNGDGELTAANPRWERAQDSLMHWAARAQNTAITGVRIDGIQELVQELRSLDPNTELDRYDHKDRRALLTIYRDALSKRPIGYLFVKTQVPHQDEVYDKLGILYPDESPAEPLPVRPVGSHSIVRNRKKGARND